MKQISSFFIFIIFLTSLKSCSNAINLQKNNVPVVSLKIQNANVGQIIPTTMHGVILETNINRDDDGGIYGELIYNRAFQEKGRSLDGWFSFGEGAIWLSSLQPLSTALPSHLHYSLNVNSTLLSGFLNHGFYGINVQRQTYTGSFFYRPLQGSYVKNDKLTLGFSDFTGQIIYGSSIVDVSNTSVDSWSQISFIISVSNSPTATKNSFFIQFPVGSKGDFDFNLISCFPPTFKNRPNGARIDIAQTLADLKPGYVRLPGGNDLEGLSIAERFIWNNTIGPLKNRPGRRGTWTGYNTEGFGLIEFMTFVEDIGATPIFTVYAGYSLDKKSVPRDELQPYIDEVVEELDFLIASANTNKMGALRASLGRTQPFDIKFVEIGNEDWIGPAADTYGYRWSAFYDALSHRYPNITFIATTTRSIMSPPAVDDHDYQVPSFFINNFRRYENIPRPGPKVLVGEFSVINDDDLNMNKFLQNARLDYPSIKSAVAESIYRIGFERNADIIIGGCYAPVLQNIDQTQWVPNLIAFNASFVVQSTSYLAQKMFGTNLGNIVLNSTASNSSVTHVSVQRGQEGDGKLGNLYFIATKHTDDNTLIVKLASVDSQDILVIMFIQDSSTSSSGTAYVLTAGTGIDPSTIHNTFMNPSAASITEMPISASNGTMWVTIPSWSVVVVTLPL